MRTIKKKILVYILQLFVICFATMPLPAQVTIGSGIEPRPGNLLDLKENNNSAENATKGLGLPRVNLTTLQPATPTELAASIGSSGEWDLNQHIGLTIYNINESQCIAKGLYVWNGDLWEKMGKQQPEVSLARTRDSLALVALYNATNGPGWTNKNNWLSSSPISEWQGVTTEPTALKCINGTAVADISVTELDLGNNQLSGNIPSEIGNLQDLEVLWLYDDQFTGQLSGSIPSTIGQLTNLQRLALYGNQLSGNIPSEIGNLVNLTIINITHNQLSGYIPSGIGNLKKITVLQLSNNQLMGAVPSELGNMDNLTILELYNNKLSGNIPSSLGRLVKLIRIQLQNNQLSGNIPNDIDGLKSLSVLNLFNNQLSGAIPSELGELTALTELDLSANLLSANIPPALGNLLILAQLNLSNNQLTGDIPANLGNLQGLEEVELHNNQLSGEIPGGLKLVTVQVFCPQYDLGGTTINMDPWTNFTCP